jgi:ATP-dependent Clp protease ATP-binding subunit ClpA
VFERFTERARQVVVLAQDESRALKHNYIGTEHLLLGLLREQDGVAMQVLESLDITVEEVRAQVARIVGQGDEVTTGQIPFTPRAKKVLELALREALSLGHNYIGSEHILLGIVRENEGVAAQILLDFDADAERIRSEVIRFLAMPRGGRARRGLLASKLSEAGDAALHAGQFDLARKLLELEIAHRTQTTEKEQSKRTVALVHHRVADFDAWKQVYDSFADIQRAGGVRAHHVWRTRDDPTMVVVVHVFDSSEAADAFFGSHDLEDAMARAGVDPSSVQIEYLDEAESGTF